MLDVYNAAFRIPDLLYGVFFAVVSAQTVVPFITKAVHEDEKDLVEKFNSLFFFFGFTLIVVSIITALFLPFVAPYVVPGFDEFQRHYFVIASLILMVQPLFLGLSALVSSLAQVKHKFILYSTAPLIYTLTIIASIPLLYPRYGVIGIACGVVVGAILSFGIQSYTLYEAKMKLSLSMFSWAHIMSHMRVAVPRSLSTVVSRVRELVYAAIATTLGVGALSVYLFAQRVIEAFIQVIVQSAATATLPLLANKHSRGEHKDYTKILKTNIITIFTMAVIAAAFIIFFRDTIVHVLYGNTPRAADIAFMVKYLAFTLPAYAMSFYFVTAFSATKDTMGLFYANVVATGLGVVALLTARSMGEGLFSLVYASWTMNVVYLLLLGFFYSRKKKLSQ